MRERVRHHPVVTGAADGGDVSDVPYRVEKPWGYELIWARTDRYVGKILHIEPGHCLAKHRVVLIVEAVTGMDVHPQIPGAP